MTATELDDLPPSPPGIDRWLFAGALVERRNANRFHSPAHARAVAALSALLSNWCREHRNAGYRAYGYGCPFRLGRDPDTLVTFDASVMSEKEPPPKDTTWVEGPPLLAVEVIELDEDFDRVEQLVGAALGASVPAVWVVNPFEKLVACHRPGRRPFLVYGGVELSGGEVLPGFRCKVAEIFE